MVVQFPVDVLVVSATCFVVSYCTRERQECALRQVVVPSIDRDIPLDFSQLLQLRIYFLILKLGSGLFHQTSREDPRNFLMLMNIKPTIISLPAMPSFTRFFFSRSISFFLRDSHPR